MLTCGTGTPGNGPTAPAGSGAAAMRGVAGPGASSTSEGSREMALGAVSTSSGSRVNVPPAELGIYFTT